MKFIKYIILYHLNNNICDHFYVVYLCKRILFSIYMKLNSKPISNKMHLGPKARYNTIHDTFQTERKKKKNTFHVTRSRREYTYYNCYDPITI